MRISLIFRVLVFAGFMYSAASAETRLAPLYDPDDFTEEEVLDIAEVVLRHQFQHSLYLRVARKSAVYLSVYGKDPSAEFAKRFEEDVIPPIRPMSKSSDKSDLKFYAGSLKRTSENQVEAYTGEANDLDQDISGVYILEKRRDKWHVIKYRSRNLR